MSEETTKGTGDLAPESGGAGAGAPETTTQETAGGLTDDMKAAIQAEVERVRREYEGPGGHIARLKSERDRMKQELERQKEQVRREAAEVLRQAHAVAQQDPEQAFNLLSPRYEQLLRQDEQARGQQEWHEWVTNVATDLELLTGDPEADGKAWEKIDAIGRKAWAENDPAQAPYVFQQALAREAKEAQKTARLAAEKERDRTLADLPNLVRTELTRALAGDGITEADLSTPGRAPGTEYHKRPATQNIADGLRARERNPVRRRSETE